MKDLNISGTEEYISKYEDDKENPTVWILGPLDEITKNALNDSATTFEVDPDQPETAKAKTIYHFNRKKLDLVRLGLKGFRGLISSQTGKEVEYKTVATPRFGGGSKNVLSDEILKRIPGQVIDELAEKISEMSKLSEEEEKN